MKIFVISLFVLIWPFFSVYGQEVPSNLDLADQAYFAVLDSLFSEIAEPELRMNGLGSEEEAFLRSGWIQFWSGRSDDKGLNVSVCVIDRFGFSIQYFDKAMSLLGVKDRLLRAGQLHLRGWIESSGTKKAIRAFNVHKNFQDSINPDRIARVEQGPFQFLKGTQHTRSLWARYFEPALVIVSLSAVVYLFFSIRT